MNLRSLPLLSVLAVLGCASDPLMPGPGADGGGDAGAGADAGADAGLLVQPPGPPSAPIVAEPRRWTWVRISPIVIT